MIKIICQINYFLLKKRKKKYFFFLFLLFCAVILETFGYLSIFPFITLLLNPDYISNSKFILFINNIIPSNSKNEFIVNYGIISLCFFILSSFLGFIIQMIQVKFVNGIILETRLDLLKNYTNRDLTFHKSKNSSELISKLFTQIDEMGQGVIFGFFELIFCTLNLLIFLIILSIINFYVTLISFIILLFFYFIIELNLKKKIKNIAGILYKSNSMALIFATEAIKLIKSAVLNNQKKYFIDRFYGEIDLIYKSRNYVRIVPRFSRFLIEVLGIGLIIGLVIYLFYVNGQITQFIETIVFFALSIYKIFPNANKCFQINVNLKSGSNQFFNIFNDLNENSYENFNLKSFEKKIKFKNIVFQYGLKKILDEVNLEINKGESILLYGKSGSGKSTMCDIIGGHIPPQSGEIIIDNNQIEYDRYKSYKKYCGYIGQDTFILNENFYNNIALSNNYDENLVIKVAKIARIDEFIKGRVDQYNEVISENGKNLSGGQRQRIAIARALYINPEIIIIDEGTSNLDIELEKEVYDLIFKNFPNKTKIVVSHRLLSEIKFDNYYKFDQGKIIETNGQKII